MEFNEEKYKSFVEPQILRCRDGDWEHAKRVVRWVKELGERRNNLSLLIAAGYIHDIGWRDVLPPGRITLEKLMQYEPEANKNSRPFARELLKEFGFLEDDINTVLRLIDAADAHGAELDDEKVIVDADTLSKLSIDHVREKFQESKWKGMYEYFAKETPKRIQTEKGKKIYPKLLKELAVVLQIENE